jgi:hypothetical protein
MGDLVPELHAMPSTADQNQLLVALTGERRGLTLRQAEVDEVAR